MNWKHLRRTRKIIHNLEKEFERTQDITLIPRIETFEHIKQHVLKRAAEEQEIINKRRKTIKGKSPNNPIIIENQDIKGSTYNNPIELD